MGAIRNPLDRAATERLSAKLAAAGGADAVIDQAIIDLIGFAPASVSSSIDAARGLAEQLLPEAHIHLGYGVTGMFPSATISDNGRTVIREAPTVPLAILRATWAMLETR